jgi:ABC transporter DrrB family efflux protein
MRGALYGYRSVAIKELLHLQRDRLTVVMALLLPVIQLSLYGFAIDFDVRHIRTMAVDLDRSRESRAYLDTLRNTQYLDIAGYLATPEEAEEKMRRGECRVAVIIPPDFARRVGTREPQTVRVLIDGSDSQVALRARMAFLRPSAPAPGVAEARFNVMYNPQMRTPTFMIPGLIGVLMQIVTVSLTSFSLVREREQGTLEQLMVSPVGRLGLMLGKLTPYAFLAMVEMGAVLLIGSLAFDVQVAGSLVTLFLLTIPFVIASLAMGLLISTVAQNQAQALQFTLLTMMPSILLSGFIFPRETMPGFIYLITFAFPVTFYLEILRGVVVRGAGLLDLTPSLLSLLAITAILLALSTLRFRKSLA